MSGIRLLVGTRKGAFILTSDGTRKQWHVERTTLCGVGAVPSQRIARRAQPPLCVAVQQLVRADHSTVG